MPPDAVAEPALPSRRDVVLGGALAAASAAAAALTASRHVSIVSQPDLADAVPQVFSRWVRRDGDGIVRPPEDARSDPMYDQELTRIYTSPSAPPVMLVIAYGRTQSDRLQVHRPEFCYPAAGFRIGRLRHVGLAVGDRTIPARLLTAQRGDRIEQLLYWTRIGEYFPVDWLSQHVARLKNSLRGIVSDGVLVRLSTLTPDADLAASTLTRFAHDLLRSLPQSERRALIGD